MKGLAWLGLAAVLPLTPPALTPPSAIAPVGIRPVDVYTLDARMTRGSGEGEQTLLAEALSLEVGHESKFQQRSEKSPERVALGLRAYAQKDGTAAIEVNWDEETPEGKLFWEPVVSAPRGQATTVFVDWHGERRALTLTVR